MLSYTKINTIYRRTIIAFIFMFVISTILFAIISDNLILASFNRLEKHYTQEHLQRLEKTIEQDLADLTTTAADWGPWDDTYSFMASQSEDYITTNLTESVFHNLKLNMMIFLNPTGIVVYAKGRDLINGRFLPVPREMIEQIENSRIFYNSEPDYRIKGLLMLLGNPVLVASHPILTSTSEGPVRGHLLIGRYLNDAEISRYEQHLNIEIAVSDVKSGYLSQQKQENHYTVQKLSNKSIAAYTILDDIFSRPAAILRIEVPSKISEIGKMTAWYLFTFLTGTVFASAFILLVFLRRNVLSRLTRISEEVELIGSKKSITTRLTSDFEKDELTTVTDAINVMLDKLELSQQQIIDSEKRYRLIAENTADTIFVLDFSLKITYVSSSVVNLRGYTAEETEQQSLKEVFTVSLEDSIHQIIFDWTNIQGNTPYELNRRSTLESEVYCKDGTKVWVENTVSLIWDKNEKPLGILVVSRDITESKKAIEQLKYCSLHDQLTGLYNRTFFEEELKRLAHSRVYPITIICADLDGLKLVNDGMGHDKGDLLLKTTAEILTKSFRRSDILCRVGGDEFAVILPQTDENAAEALVNRIRTTLKLNNSVGTVPLGVSFGVATAKTEETSLSKLYKQADDLMYKDKLYRNASNRNRIVEALLAALSERDYIAEGHAHRLTEFCQIMGLRLNITSGQLADLILLSRVHDLGKVGIPDSILFKKGPLSKEEVSVMQRHPEIGYRIAMTSPDLSPVAELILKHHEKWDGSGYPLGLKGEEIPLECRILSIIDAFDAITHDRPYRKAASKQEAINEIKKHAGTQFDPVMVDLFIDMLDSLTFEQETRTHDCPVEIPLSPNNISYQY